MASDPSKKSDSIDASVPKAVVSRLSLYLRELLRLQLDGNETTSSTQLGKLLGFSDAQVRKDLAYFGQFGYPGIGYRCDELIAAVRKILGTNRAWRVAIIGAGNLGRALLGYKGFQDDTFRIVAAFDLDEQKVGEPIDDVPVFHLDELSEQTARLGIRLAIIAVPSTAAQTVANRVTEAGIEGVLNFAPVTLALPDQVSAVGVDLAIELEELSFAVVNKAEK